MIVIDNIRYIADRYSSRSFHDEHSKLERRFWTVILMVMDYDKARFRASFELVLGQYYTLFYNYLDFQQQILLRLEKYDTELILKDLKSEIVKNKVSEYEKNKEMLIEHLERILKELPFGSDLKTVKPNLNKTYNPEWPQPEQVLNFLFKYFIQDFELNSYDWPHKKFPLAESNELREILSGLLQGYALSNIREYYIANESSGVDIKAFKEADSAAEAVRMAMIELPYEYLDKTQFVNFIQMLYRVKGEEPSKESLQKAIKRSVK